MQIEGSRVLVTGASSGIGAALAPQLAARGATVAIVARRRDRLEAVLAECRAHAPESQLFVADLGDLDAAEQVAHDAVTALGGVDVLVNNAAIPKRVPVSRITQAEVEETMRVNYLSPVRLTLALLPAWLTTARGCVVNVSSTGGRIPIPNESAYCASKYALAAWSEVMRIDLHGTGVEVKLVLPGPIATEIWDQPGNDEALFDIDKVSAADCAAGIVAAIEGSGFEYWVPEVFPGGVDAKQMAVDKAAHCDRNVEGMGAFVASLRDA